MSDRPILLSAPLVRALLDGRKTQTRRIFTSPKPFAPDDDIAVQIATGTITPRFHVGDRLWMREAHAIYVAHGQHREDGHRWGPWGGLPTTISPNRDRIAYYREGFDRSFSGRWKPSIHMPRWASRLTLAVTDVRVERLNDISEADALAEGIARCDFPYDDGEAREAFARLWNHIYGPDAWDANPWVVAITFAVHLGNIDAMETAP